MLALGLGLSSPTVQPITWQERAQFCFYETLGGAGILTFLLSAEIATENEYRSSAPPILFIIGGIYVFCKSHDKLEPLREKLNTVIIQG